MSASLFNLILTTSAFAAISSFKIASPVELDMNSLHIFAAHHLQQEQLYIYETTPISEAPDSLCEVLSDGSAWAAILPTSPITQQMIAFMAASINLPTIAISPSDFNYPLPPASINLAPPADILIEPIRKLLLEYSASNEVAIVYEDARDINVLRDLLQPPTQAYLLRQMPTPDKNDFRPLLKHISVGLGIDSIVVLIHSLERLFSFLQQAADFGMCSTHYHYIIANLDTPTLNLSSSETRACNITTFSLYDYASSEVDLVRELVTAYTGNSFNALMVL